MGKDDFVGEALGGNCCPHSSLNLVMSCFDKASARLASLGIFMIVKRALSVICRRAETFSAWSIAGESDLPCLLSARTKGSQSEYKMLCLPLAMSGKATPNTTGPSASKLAGEASCIHSGGTSMTV